MKYFEKRTLLLAIIPLILALLSATVVSKVASSTEFHQASLEALDENQTTVMELAAASTAASAAITLIPGDVATPIAEKLADLSSYFLLVLCAIYLEKYLLTVTGYAAFHILIPIACVCGSLFVFLRWNILREIAKRLAIFSIAIFLVIPASLKISALIEETYSASIEQTLETAKQATTEIESSADGEETEQGLLSGWLSKVTDGISDVATGVSEKVGDLLNDLIEALAVMLVTSCVIPILVLLFFVWIIKILIGIEIPINYRGLSNGEKPLFSRANKTKDPL